MLARSPGTLPEVRVWSAKTDRFSSRPIQKPNPLTLGGPNPDPYPSTVSFCLDLLHPSVPISGSAFQVPHLCSHSDMLMLIVKYWHWYGTVCFWRIGCLNAQNEHRHTTYHILTMRVNRVSTIVGHASWVIWGATGYTQSLIMYWLPL